MSDGNLLDAIPDKLPEELTQTLAGGKGVRIERIVSLGHASGEHEWMDQSEHEWVLLLTGGAVLQWADGTEQTLAPGDYVLIPAGARHRVAGTLPDEHSIWLAVFFRADQPATG